MARTLEELLKEGRDYHKNHLEIVQEELEQGYDFHALEFISEIALSESLRKEGFVGGMLISTGGPAYRWVWRRDEKGAIVEIRAQYQDWYMEWVTIPSTKKQEAFMRKLFKIVKIYD